MIFSDLIREGRAYGKRALDNLLSPITADIAQALFIGTLTYSAVDINHPLMYAALAAILSLEFSQTRALIKEMHDDL